MKQKSVILYRKNDSKNRESWRVNGFLRKEYVRCGKKTCRCYKGIKHGWYWYLYWHDKFNWRKRYVKRKDLDVVRAALTRGHEWHDQLVMRHQELKNNIANSEQLYKLTKQGYILPPDVIEESVKTFAFGIHAMKLCKSRQWYYLWPDYMVQLGVFDWVVKNIWKDRFVSGN